MLENVPSDMGIQQTFRSTCAFGQSDQNLPTDSRRAVVSFWRKNVYNTG